MLFRSLLIAGPLAVAAFTGAAPADEIRTGPKAVLELFTSQGCSSCPEADAMLRRLSEDPAMVTLAYHVDYWDYIGWPDTFGASANSERQRDYASSWGSSRIFTPQLIVNGEKGVVGSRKSDVEGLVSAAALTLPVSLRAGNDMLEVEVAAQPDAVEAMVWLVTFIDEAEVTIERGENGGKTITYSQIVTGRQVLGMYEPATGATFKLPLAEVLLAPADGVAILVQTERGEGLPGPILGAATYRH